MENEKKKMINTTIENKERHENKKLRSRTNRM